MCSRAVVVQQSGDTCSPSSLFSYTSKKVTGEDKKVFFFFLSFLPGKQGMCVEGFSSPPPPRPSCGQKKKRDMGRRMEHQSALLPADAACVSFPSFIFIYLEMLFHANSICVHPKVFLWGGREDYPILPILPPPPSFFRNQLLLPHKRAEIMQSAKVVWESGGDTLFPSLPTAG